MPADINTTVSGAVKPERSGAAPINPHAPTAEELAATHETNVMDLASQWDLMRWKFTRHKRAGGALWIVLFIYFVGAFVEIIASRDPNATSGTYRYVPPVTIHLF